MNKRIQWLDAVKGLAILLVVIGHILDGYLNAEMFPQSAGFLQMGYNIIYSFHMPLFFVLSGYVFYRAYCMDIQAKSTRYKQQLVNIVWVYLVFSLAQWAFKMMFASYTNEAYTMEDLLLVLIKPMAPYWYLYVMFFLYLICYTIQKRQMESKYVMLIALSLNVVSQCMHFSMTFPLRLILYYFVFFYLGIYLSEHQKTKLVKNSALGVYVGISIISFAYIVFANNDLIDEKLFGVGACGISFMIVVAFMRFRWLYERKILRMCGRYSLEIYVMHCFITAANRSILPRLGITNIYLSISVNMCMAVAIPIVVAWVLKRTHLYGIVFKPAGNFCGRNQE